MRTITGNIKILADEKYANKKLEFILCNLYGKQISNLDVDGQIATKKSITTDEEGNFKIELFETETSKIPMYYKIIFIDNPDIEDIKLFVQQGSDSIDFLKLLFPLPKLNMFYETKNQNDIAISSGISIPSIIYSGTINNKGTMFDSIFKCCKITAFNLDIIKNFLFCFFY